MPSRSAMLPPLKIIKAALGRTTEALAFELSEPGGTTPDWSDLEWRLASAAAAAHGVSPLLSRSSAWQDPAWQQFLEDQRDHVAHRHRRIAALLERIDCAALAAGVPIVPMKGSALHALGIYAPGDRPMADIDLLVRDSDVERAAELLRDVGYVESYASWKHRLFKPATGKPLHGLGEHRDTPVNIELHTRIHERLPIAIVDITERIYPPESHPGLNPYPSTGALMSHLLLHAAGNICGRNLRLIHLNDIALLAARMTAADWDVLRDETAADSPWWALPPLRLAARYFGRAIPETELARLEPGCPSLLRAISRRQTLTQVSCSELWVHALPGIEWSRTIRHAGYYIRNRLRPTREHLKERADAARTQLWAQGQRWATLSNGRRILAGLTRSVPRMDALYVVRAALEARSPAT